MYYLYSPEHEVKIPEIKKLDGESIPERTYIEDARAIYKDKKLNRFFRRPTGDDSHGEFELFHTQSLEDVKYIQEKMFEYCGEMFEIREFHK